MFSSVVLPEPDAPTIPISSPAWTTQSRPCRMRSRFSPEPNSFTRPESSRTASRTAIVASLRHGRAGQGLLGRRLGGLAVGGGRGRGAGFALGARVVEQELVALRQALQ